MVAAVWSGAKWWWRIWRCIPMASLVNIALCAGAIVVASAERSSSLRGTTADVQREDDEAADLSGDFLIGALTFGWRSSTYQHTWPDMEFGWKIIAGSIIGLFGGAFGSVGGVGGGGIFLPMLTLIIGFDVKSATAISKCMIMGAAVSTVYYNMKLRHPTIDMPIFDYDLLLLTAPVLLLGISIGVSLNVVLAAWMITVLQIVLFLATAIKAFFKGVETWKKETLLKTEEARQVEADVNLGVEYDALLSNPHEKATEVSVLKNVYWKEFGLICFVWVTFLALQVIKNYTTTCSGAYWVINSLQIPVSVGVSSYQGIRLYKGYRAIGSTGAHGRNLKIQQLVLYCSLGVIGGIVGGLLGQGGGFVMGPVFLELGVPPEVASATAALGMVFSASMSVAEYYLLKRFPVPYALYFVAVTTVAAFIGQDIVRKLIMLLGRASIIIFILSFTIFVSAFCLGGVGISNIITKIEQHDYMGLENLCDA